MHFISVMCVTSYAQLFLHLGLFVKIGDRLPSLLPFLPLPSISPSLEPLPIPILGSVPVIQMVYKVRSQSARLLLCTYIHISSLSVFSDAKRRAAAYLLGGFVS